MSFRLKTILGIALIEAILLLVLILSSLGYLRESNTEEIENSAFALAKLFATTAKDAVIANDLATLDAFVEEGIKNEGLSYLRFVGEDHILLSEGGKPGLLARDFIADQSIEMINDQLFDVTAKIDESGYTFGHVQLGVSTEKLEQIMAEAKERFYLIAAIEILLVALFSYLLGTYLTRQLARLEDGAQRIADGDIGHEVDVYGKDEIARTVETFNTMSRQLKHLYREIENDQRRLMAIMDTVIDGVVTIDSNGIIQSVNKNILDIFGFTVEELIAKNVSMLMPSPYREQHDSYLQNYINGGEAKVIGSRREVIGIKKNGSQFPLELAVNELKFDDEQIFVGVLRDLTEITEINKELNKSKILNAEILDSALDAIVTITTDGKVIAFNPAAEKLFGYSAADIKGKDFVDYLSHANNEYLFSLYQDDQLYFDELIELAAITNTGKQVPIEMVITPIKVGEESYINTFIRDISSRKQAEKMMLHAREEAESASRAKSEFLAVMSHEIRTPMNAILGSMSLLEQEEMKADQRKYIRMANEAGKSLLWLINDILDFSKIEAGKLELEISTFDLVPLVEDTLDLMQFRAKEKGIEIASWFDINLPVHVIGDQGKLRQILINLVSNAVKFTHEGGILIGCRAYDDQTIQFEITDTGIGLADETIPRLFDQFTQVDSSAKRKYGGSGLGLAISKGLAQLMQGDIGVMSELEVGSQFWLRLPHNNAGDVCLKDIYSRLDARAILHETNPVARCALMRQMEQMGVVTEIATDNAQTSWIEIERNNVRKKFEIYGPGKQNALQEDTFTKPLYLKTVYAMLSQRTEGLEDQETERRTINREALKGKRILLAEDSQANQIIARAMLENAGYEVYVVSNGKEALEAVKEFPFDLVLMDISMPEMDGIEATRSIRRLPGEAGHQKIIALTANVFKDDIDRCLEVGMHGFISKPIEKRKLLKTITEHILGDVPENRTEQKSNAEDKACLDMSLLEQLIDDVGADVAPTMLDVYIRETRDRVNKIEQAAAEQDLTVLRAEAHALKGSSGSLGVVGLQRYAFEVELACKELRNSDALKIARVLPQMAEQCLDELARYLG
jgi:PAS domain S-box-containing protein